MRDQVFAHGECVAAGFFASNRKEARAKAKHAVIWRCEKYSVLVMCQVFSVSRSGYYSFVKR